MSATTRPARPGEEDGVDYVFLDRATFEKWQEHDEFVESFEVFGNCYGTPKRPLIDHLAAGDDVILEIDVQGAMAVRKAFPDAVLVFLRPPSREVQQERLLTRAGDAARHASSAGWPRPTPRRRWRSEFDLVVVNDDLETAVEQVAAILEARRSW